ncbi:MAG: XTP/dITP diphosphatase [Desulfuromonadales bacterium]|nr:XTP/dITP diphosphatase [Desulfuromonadales bacterium]MDW7758386.1 XTP/dITP diphosphatase [Desulfuromonadales bacterium]
MDLVVATRNQGKLKEIRRLLMDTGVNVRGLDEFPGVPEVEEDGDSFEANARKKAETVAATVGLWTLADDSGLTVDALGGRPGVHSARYAGPEATDADNNAKLIQELAEVPRIQRKGAFNCCMALSRPGEPTRVFHGRIEGLLLDEPRGEGGFGYDPLFLVREYGKTMAELAIEVKNRISHRGQALRQALDWIKDNLL